MNRLSIVFSLLLIVSVTATLGSVIKAKNPNGQEIEALLSDAGLDHYPEMVPSRQELEALLAQAKLKGEKSSRDDREESEMSKRIVAPRDLVVRKVTIELENESHRDWNDPSEYFRYGTADGILPSPVANGETVKFEARNKHGVLNLHGTVGVFTYYIPSRNETLAVMWFVPYSYVFGIHNLWNVKLYSGKATADLKMYNELKQEKPFNPDYWHEKDLSPCLKAHGFMSPSGQATLEIKVMLA